MTDTELIQSFIDTTFKIDIRLNDYGVINGYTVSDDIYHIKNKEHFAEVITLLYSDFYMSNGMSVREYAREYFTNIKENSLGEIYEHLKGVTIRLGPTNWENVKDGELWEWESLVDELDGRYTRQSIKAIYEEWRMDKVEKESTRIMNEEWGENIF